MQYTYLHNGIRMSKARCNESTTYTMAFVRLSVRHTRVPFLKMVKHIKLFSLLRSPAVAYLGGRRWCDRPWSDHTFLANFALFCRLHFATEPYKIRVQRHGRLYIACYTDVHARPEASSEWHVRVYNYGEVATALELQQTDCGKRCPSRRHKWYVQWRHRDRASCRFLRSPNDTVMAWQLDRECSRWSARPASDSKL